MVAELTMEKKKVKFIRKNGRIIPIRVKEGLTEAAAGLGIAVGAGVAAERTFAAGRKLQRASRIATKRASIAYESGKFKSQTLRFKQAVATANKASATFKASRALLGISTFVGAGLIFSGLGKMQNKKDQKNELLQYLRFGIAGTAAGIGTRIFKRGLIKSFPGLVLR